MLQGHPVNLNELIKHRTTCPFCSEKLVTYFHSTRRQTIKYDDNRIIAIFDMNSLNKTQVNYKVGYSFCLEDNSFQIEFFTDDGTIYFNAINTDMMKKFMEFHRNLGGRYSFSRKCTFCKKYTYSSKQFGLNFKTSQTEDTSLAHESFAFALSTTEGASKVIILSNKYLFDSPISEIHFWRGLPEDANYDRPYPPGHQLLVLPFIPFVSIQETANRINGLLIFS
jgi:hypothetical protein